jgi:UDP-N-acetylmuramoyl-tripeptide--D-alanyl-D-alanine ligase
VKRMLSWILPIAPGRLVYMLQQQEYDTNKFIKWMLRYPDLWQIQRRGAFVRTKRALALKVFAVVVYWAWAGLVVAVSLEDTRYLLALSIAGLISAYMLAILNLCLQVAVVSPGQRKEIAQAKIRINQMKDTPRISVLGSFGKTSMKELLNTVLSEGQKVAVTPGNKNVLISHARWVKGLPNDCDVLVFEYGEAEPGDIRKLASFSMPTHAVVTGLAPAHLDYYPSLEAVADDLANILDFVEPQDVWFNDHARLLSDRFAGAHGYSSESSGAASVNGVKVDFSGTTFTVKQGKKSATYQTKLLGAHHIGPLLAVIDIARKLGLSDEQIKTGVAATRPYEHRMQPRSLHGAWIIDDAYNGNIEGMKAGLKLLAALPAQRRIYVTPGLVDQGNENERVHMELGKLIAQSAPDVVVLMQNQNTPYIEQGLREEGFDGQVTLEDDPLGYYTGLERHLAAGDVVMLQNDLPDSYS